MAKGYWLFKSDPEDFGLSHLKKCKNKTTLWDGVRNFQARNLLRDKIQVGDDVLFYHSQEKPPAVVALARVVRAGYPDPTQFDKRAKYHDPKSTRDDPRWFVVDIQHVRDLARPVGLPEIRESPGLEEMVLVNRSRLSVQPVRPAEWKIILKLGASKS
jgi:predicted RNA-binding protein with PUA-like domain